MNDRELCEMFGTTLEEVEREVTKVEAGDYSSFDFSRVTDGIPMQEDKLRTITTPVGESRLAAIKRITEAQGISRSEFVRMAIDHELIAQQA